ncbi:hypothetical protein [Streptomyces sp. t39]|uniref:hypothetical protein n=1 Tax=Streptomyces sp. t39 TaxID=1828156 RepID=UPI0011CE8EC1|nr:hypothetical protein [Streptomyces sp. t39]TXS51608.1 hypothetical protein EAO77_27605 [Streptomyces sp. t39]
MATNTTPILTALPGTGWYASLKEHDGLHSSTHVIGWLVHADGEFRPIVLHEGKPVDATTLPNFLRVFPGKP